jgi:MFS family permease
LSEKRLYDFNFVLACTAHLFFTTGNTLLVHFAGWVSFLGGDERDIGWIMGAGSLLALLVRPWVGEFIDRFGARRVWWVGAVIFAIATAWMGRFQVLDWGIYALRMVQVMGSALILTTGLTYIASTTPVERRAEAFGSFGLGGFIGMIIGPTAGDFLLGGIDSSRSGFVTLFLVAGCMGIGSLILVYFLRPQVRPAVVVHVPFFKTARRYWPGGIYFAVIVFGIGLAVPFGFLRRYVEILGLEWMAPFYWVYAATAFAIRVYFRRLPDQLGPHRVAMMGAAAMAVGMAIFPWVGTVGQLAWPAFFCGAGHAFIFNTVAAIAMSPFPPEAQGAGSALYWISLDAGVLIGGPFIGLISFYSSYTTMFLTLSALFVVASIGIGMMQAGKRRAKPAVG